MSKKELQASELDRVSGGSVDDYTHFGRCPSCKMTYDRDSSYPVGFLFKSEKHGCSYTRTYKCPACGYEWK